METGTGTIGQGLGLADIEGARERIAPHIRRTPMEPSPSLAALTGAPVHLKLEHHQSTGSFKLRGATNAVLRLSPEERTRGIVGVSTGNHGRALAHAAAAVGARAVICMSALVPQNKRDAIAAEGAEIRIVGRSQDEAQHEVDRLVREEGMVMLPPFDHADIIAGQGTLGLEILDDLPDVETVLVQLSGGGLIAGVALALKAVNPAIRVIAVSMERGAAMHASLKAGHPVEVEELPTLADSLGGGIGLDNRYTFAMARDLVDEVMLLDEAEIAGGIRHAYWQERQIVEGAGAVGIAAILTGRLGRTGRTCAILSGGNIDMALHHRIAGGENVDLAREPAS
ncbi:hydroxyectoine utilization dehydratase EutB [Kaustia mangrovi]|uniref:Hydroxyectoine utilization dehydratase EutB n=1 Tax=Kaustia mangrovi TaxID=2593653 RepID=A0A7S8HC22_9HYPH|nr:hydroxyectoine utilization dehydratase EutB [Kaustia mangrovi]QPC43156.1 hydroxyectoine utilization dehydratase EutB [Kaustia mangrovi]